MTSDHRSAIQDARLTRGRPRQKPPIKRARLRITPGLIMCVTSFSACGVPTDPSAVTIPADALPDQVAPGREDPVGLGTLNAGSALIWMVGPDDRLIPVSRNVEQTPESVLEQLLLGPTVSERQGETPLSSASFRETEIESVEVNPFTETAHVDLAEGSLSLIVGSEQFVAFAQMVFTLVELEGISGVVFSIAGEQTAVPIDRGASEPGEAVTRQDFSSLNQHPFPTFPTVPLESSPKLVWLFNSDGYLNAVVRHDVRTLPAMLDTLMTSPQISEREAGLTTYLGANALARKSSIDSESGIATIDLNELALPESTEDRSRALAQLVFSVTSRPNISGLIVTVADSAVTVDIGGEVRSTDLAMDREDFEHFLDP